MKITINIFTENRVLFEQIKSAVGDMADCSFNAETVVEDEVAFVDYNWPKREALIQSLAEQAIYTVLVISEHVPNLEKEVLNFLQFGEQNQLIDDVVLIPIRALEVRSKIYHLNHILKLKGLTSVNKSVKTLIEKIDEDLKIAKSIQKKFIPEKFVIPGFKISHKYLSGLKSGGDYFDVFECQDDSNIGIFVSDSSGYGLSSALLSIMLRTAFRFSDASRDGPQKMIERIFNEVKMAMKPNEDLSLFFGLLNKNTLEFKYSSVGYIRFYRGTEPHSEVSEPLRIKDKFTGSQHQMNLHAGERLSFLTDGFVDGPTGEDQLAEILKDMETKEASDLINEITFRVKNSYSSKEDLPPQDCSVIVFEIDKNRLRLAKG